MRRLRSGTLRRLRRLLQSLLCLSPRRFRRQAISHLRHYRIGSVRPIPTVYLRLYFHRSWHRPKEDRSTRCRTRKGTWVTQKGQMTRSRSRDAVSTKWKQKSAQQNQNWHLTFLWARDPVGQGIYILLKWTFCVRAISTPLPSPSASQRPPGLAAGSNPQSHVTKTWLKSNSFYHFTHPNLPHSNDSRRASSPSRSIISEEVSLLPESCACRSLGKAKAMTAIGGRSRMNYKELKDHILVGKKGVTEPNLEDGGRKEVETPYHFYYDVNGSVYYIWYDLGWRCVARSFAI